MEPDLVEVQVDDGPRDDPPLRVRRYLTVIAATLVVGGIALAGRAVDAPAPTPTEVATTSLRGATASLAAPWAERWRTAGTVVSVGDLVLVSTPDGTGVRALTPAGGALWGPVATGDTCAPSGAGAVCLAEDRVATAIAPGGTVSATLAAPPGLVDRWVVDGDVVTVAVRDGQVTAQRWVPPGHRGVTWMWQGTADGTVPAPEHGPTWVRIGGVVLDLATGRQIATPADAVTLPAWGAVLGPNDGSGAVPVIADGTQIVVAGLRHYPGPAHLLVEGVIVTGTDEVTAHRTVDGVALWRAPASAAVSDGVAVGLIEPGDAGARLSARDVVSGAELWSVDLGEATYAGATSDGVVLQVGSDVVAVGP